MGALKEDEEDRRCMSRGDGRDVALVGRKKKSEREGGGKVEVEQERH